MADTETWTEQFPHPGAPPPRPTTGRVTPELTAYNDWVRKLRKHRVAVAVDQLAEHERSSPPLTAAETIALTFGVMLLDGSMAAQDIFSGLFG